MKVVDYEGVYYAVPNWANYIAADANLKVWVYEYEPVWDAALGIYEAEGGRRELARVNKNAPELKRI